MILVEHAVVVTMDPARRILMDGSVLIDGERIVQVGRAADVKPPPAPERPPPEPLPSPWAPRPSVRSPSGLRSAEGICARHGGWRVDTGRTWHCAYRHRRVAT